MKSSVSNPQLPIFKPVINKAKKRNSRMNKKLLTLIFSFHVLLVFGQSESKIIDSLMNNYYHSGEFNGSILVAKDGETILKKGYGYANFEWSIPNNPETKFYIGSLTKQFTSMLIMQLVEEQKLDLDAKISNYLPTFNKSIADSITIFHLLTHTSGLMDYTNEEFWEDSVKLFHTRDYILNNYCGKSLKFVSGTQFEYSNAGYFVLGVIIERITGKDFEEVLRERILIPLGMKNTGMFNPSKIVDESATGYIKSNDLMQRASYLDLRNVFSAGGMYSTVEDLFIWDKALYSETLITSKYKDMLFKPYLSNYGFGWGILDYKLGNSGKSIHVITHKGAVKGYKSILFRITNNQHTIILLDNTYSESLDFEMCEKIMEILYHENINN